MEKLEEKTVKSTKLFEGKIIDLRLDEVELPDGKMSSREIVEHSGGVAIIPYHKGKVTLVEQFRKPVEEIVLEIPAGKLEPNEELLGCARRELEEETGYKAKSLEWLCEFYTSPGFTDEVIHIYLAQELTEYQQQVDDEEFIRLREFSIKEIKDKIKTGEINDAKTIIGLQYLLNYLKE